MVLMIISKAQDKNCRAAWTKKAKPKPHRAHSLAEAVLGAMGISGHGRLEASAKIGCVSSRADALMRAGEETHTSRHLDFEQQREALARVWADARPLASIAGNGAEETVSSGSVRCLVAGTCCFFSLDDGDCEQGFDDCYNVDDGHALLDLPDDAAYSCTAVQGGFSDKTSGGGNDPSDGGHDSAGEDSAGSALAVAAPMACAGGKLELRGLDDASGRDSEHDTESTAPTIGEACDSGTGQCKQALDIDLAASDKEIGKLLRSAIRFGPSSNSSGVVKLRLRLDLQQQRD